MGNCAMCSREGAIEQGGAHRLARLMSCEPDPSESELHPSNGPGYRGDPATMINGTEKPHRSEWPEGEAPQCCWGGCGSCVDTYAYCSESPAQCGQCQGIMKACPIGSSTETLPPGADIPAIDEFGMEWWCCWAGECGDHCSKPGTIDGDWCLASSSNCGECAGSVAKCELPPPPMLEVGDNISEHVAPDGSSWKCCIEQATCGQCYPGLLSALNDQSWCAESIDNCNQCNGGVVACPDDRRLVHEKAIGLATTSATLSSVLLLVGLVALVH